MRRRGREKFRTNERPNSERRRRERGRLVCRLQKNKQKDSGGKRKRGGGGTRKRGGGGTRRRKGNGERRRKGESKREGDVRRRIARGGKRRGRK